MIHVTSSKRISIWQTFRTAAWLEWQAQGNWTKPWLFLFYILARPLTALAIVVCLAIFRVSDHVARERGHIDRPMGD